MPNPADILFLNRSDVELLLSYRECIALMRTAMTSVSSQEAVQPVRTVMKIPEGTGLLGMMPGYMKAPENFGIKVVTVFPDNFGTEHPSHQGLVALYDAKTGVPKAILDGGAVTAIRTAAASALATDLLARDDAKTVTIFGYGEQAQTHIEALCALEKFQSFRIWGRSFEKAQAFAAEQTERHGVKVVAVAEARSSLIGADIVCTTTASAEPILFGAWLDPGMHLNIVGSSIPTTREIDSEAVKRSKLYCDYKSSFEALGGDYRIALEEGRIEASHLIGEIGEILLGACPGREEREEITLFKSLGMISEDLIACQHVYERAVAEGKGQKVRM